MPSCKKAYNYIEKANGTHRIKTAMLCLRIIWDSQYLIYLKCLRELGIKNGTNVSCKCQSSNVTCIIEQFIILDLEFFTETWKGIFQSE